VRPGKAACSSGGRSGCAIEPLRNGPRSFDPPLALLLHVEAQGRADAGFPLRKGEIIALLYRYRYPREDAIKLLRFIDWLIRLPLPLELALRRELAELEEQTKMSYVASRERFAREEGLALGIEQGRQQGRHEGEAHASRRGEAAPRGAFAVGAGSGGVDQCGAAETGQRSAVGSLVLTPSPARRQHG
jgi:hypothetical protein